MASNSSIGTRFQARPPWRLPTPTPLRRLLAAQVTRIFNDAGRGEKPVVRRPDGLFGPTAVAWRVHGDVTSMMIGGIASLLLQALHPAVLAGVWDHSNFRSDMHGRLRRTARFIALTTYGSRAEAEAVIDRVRQIHRHVTGTLPDGTPYRADDPHLLAWVHVTEALSFLEGWQRYGEAPLGAADQDRYFAEVARIGRALGADPLPTSRAEAEQLIRDMRPELRVDDRTREVAALILSQQIGNPLLAPALGMVMQAGVDLLPDWARAMHGVPARPLQRHATRAGALTLARTLRWAFAAPRG